MGMDACPHCGEGLCPDCGVLLPLTATVCANCGAEFGIFCSHCQEEVPPDAELCPYCGEVLGEVETAVSTTPSALYLGFVRK